MKRRWALALAVVATTTIAFQAAGELDVNFVDVSGYPLVRVVFTPPEELRGVELERDQVAVSQDGEPVDFVLRDLGTEPLEAVLLVDTSGSMAGAPITAAREAARSFVDQLPAGSDIAVVGFGTEVEILADFSASSDEVLVAIDSLTTGGETAVYDAVIEALILVESAPTSRQFVVLLSDGGDTVSAATLDDVTTALGQVEVGFFAVSLLGTEFDPVALDAMAEASGGRVVAADDTAGLLGVYDDIAAELASQYAAIVETIHGGRSSFVVSVEGSDGPVSRSFELELPGDSGPPPTQPTGSIDPTRIIPTMPTIRSVTPPTIEVVPDPGWLGSDAARLTGLAAMFVVFSLIFWMALKPQETAARRRGVGDLPTASDPFFADGRFSRFNKRMQERIESFLDRRNRTGGIAGALESAGVALRPGEFVLLTLVLATVGTLLGLVAGNLPLAGLLGIGVLAGSRVVLSTKARKRKAAFADQLEGALQLMAGSLRAGYGISQAINTVANEAEEPSATEFARVGVEARLGRELHDALVALAERMENRDFRWVADAIDIQQGVGGDLAEILDTVGSTIRDRNQIRRQVHALSAEGRLSAIILISLPFALAALIAVANPEYLAELTGTTVGRVLMIVGGVLMTLGTVWIRRITRIVF